MMMSSLINHFVMVEVPRWRHLSYFFSLDLSKNRQRGPTSQLWTSQRQWHLDCFGWRSDQSRARTECDWFYILSVFCRYLTLLEFENILTWEVIIGFASLFRHIKLVQIQVLFVEHQWTLLILEMLVKPIDSSHHQISAVQILWDLNLYGITWLSIFLG